MLIMFFNWLLPNRLAVHLHDTELRMWTWDHSAEGAARNGKSGD